MHDRNVDSFWAVWMDGKDWPELFASESLAKDRAHQLARQHVGREAHVLKMSSVGSAIYPATPTLNGVLSC